MPNTYTCPCHGEITHPRDCAGCPAGARRRGRPAHHGRCFDCHAILGATPENFTPTMLHRIAEGGVIRCRPCDKANRRQQETPEMRAKREAKSQAWYDAKTARQAAEHAAGGWWWRVGFRASEQDAFDGAVGRVTNRDSVP